MSNREKFQDNPLSKVCTTIYFNYCKPGDRLSKVAEHIPPEDIKQHLHIDPYNDEVIAVKVYKIPVKDKFIYFQVDGILIGRDTETINWVLNIDDERESIVDDGDEYLLEMEMLSWLLYQGYSIP